MLELSRFIAGAEFPEFPVEGDPAERLIDPLEGEGAGKAIETAGESAVKNIPVELPGGIEIPKAITAELPEATRASIETAVKGVPVHPEGIMGQTIQAKFVETFSTPEGAADFHDSSMSRALAETKGDITKLTPEKVKLSYIEEAKARVKSITTRFKTFIGDSVKGAVEDIKDPDLNSERPYKNGAKLTDEMVENPDKVSAQLNEDAKAIEKANPDWKERVKQVAGYGAKGLLVLAVIGAFVPGGANVVTKLSQMAGQAVNKIINIAANILKAFFGPILKAFWDTVKKFKYPLIIIALIIVFMFIRGIIG